VGVGGTAYGTKVRTAPNPLSPFVVKFLGAEPIEHKFIFILVGADYRGQIFKIF
jgi:hypothetical protein